ncbi:MULTISPECIES: ATP-binding protein [unclassified Streptomyces]|uniref:ATP-binding protein n=1 Tax=unclassified Streptomyces TaxID=2593676 RepID=UPI002E31F2EC|nr:MULTISPECIES: ATP-binding protein [unclassified Streptomyces]
MKTIGSDTSDPLPTGPPVMGQRRRLTLSGTSGQVAKGREFAKQVLRDWGWDGTETADDALLIVSELVTNAGVHAGGCHQLLLVAGESLRIEVFDGDPEPPRPRERHQRGTPGGQGLYIVQRLSDRWGTVPHDTGKSVFAEIEADRLVTGRPAPKPAPPEASLN